MRTRTHLSGESERRLVESLLLGVPDVGGDDLGEREIGGARGELLAVLLCLDRELTAHGILNVGDCGVEFGGGKGTHCGGGVGEERVLRESCCARQMSPELVMYTARRKADHMHGFKG